MEEYLILQICHALIKLTVTRFVPSSLFYLFLINPCERLFQTVSYIFIDEHPQRVQYSQSRDRIKAISCLMLSQLVVSSTPRKVFFLGVHSICYVHSKETQKAHKSTSRPIFVHVKHFTKVTNNSGCGTGGDHSQNGFGQWQ